MQVVAVSQKLRLQTIWSTWIASVSFTSLASWCQWEELSLIWSLQVRRHLLCLTLKGREAEHFAGFRGCRFIYLLVWKRVCLSQRRKREPKLQRAMFFQWTQHEVWVSAMLMLKDAILPMKGNKELSELRAEGVTKPLLLYLMDFNGCYYNFTQSVAKSALFHSAASWKLFLLVKVVKSDATGRKYTKT